MDVPITCDCPAGFIGQICEINVDECASNPCVNYGYSTRCVDYINGYECECPIGYGGSECSTELNECDSEPCQNGGRCNDRFNGFTCSCPSGFTGVVCEININECLSFPCQNQGRCVDGANFFSCRCPLGFHGYRCQYKDNACASMPCRNGGRCIGIAGGFHCVCAAGYHGRICTQRQTTSSICNRQTCMNGGRCIEQRHGYTCHCPSGFTGLNCETVETNGCAMYPCRNGGICENTMNGYLCRCPTGFTGRRCERGFNTNVCSNSNCLNGGTCESDREFTYCMCANGYSGRICQFHEKDYSVRLVGGEFDYEGRVEVFYRNKWGPIADNEWTLEDASTVCHHLGYHSATEAFAHSEYGSSRGSAQICEMVCSGNEHVIEDCVLNQPAAGVGCSHKAHVGVVCSELSSPCPVSWRSWGSSCYYIDPKPRTWEDAKQTCQNKGASLVHIESEIENEFLRDYMETNHGGYLAAWIGLTDIKAEGTWDWLGQQNNSFQNWNLGEPNNGGMTIIRTSKSVMMSSVDQTTGGQNCVELLTVNGKWNDLECSMKRQTVCETVQETVSSITKMSSGLIAVITVIVIVFIVGGVVAGGLILT